MCHLLLSKMRVTLFAGVYTGRDLEGYNRARRIIGREQSPKFVAIKADYISLDTCYQLGSGDL